MTENNAAQAASESAFPEQTKFDRLYNRTFKGYGLDAERLAHAELFWKEGHRLALLSKLRAPVADSTLPLEKALHELVSKIAPGLDTGDLLQDAQRASAMLDAIQASAPVAGEALAVEIYVYREGNRYLASALLPIDTPLRPGLNTLYAAPQTSEPVSAPSAETLRLAGVIADKIEDGTLFQGGILSRRELADKVRAVVRFAQQSAPVADR